MALKDLFARHERGEVLLPLLKRYLTQQEEGKAKGVLSHKMERVRDAELTIEAFQSRIHEVQEEEPTDQQYFHPSSLGTCMRQLWFHQFHAPGGRDQTGEDVMRRHMTLEMGTYTHVMFQNLCEVAGYLQQREVGFVNRKHRLMGHGDGLLRFSKEEIEEELWKQTKGHFLLEIKTINPRGFTGLREPHFGYRQQVHAYMGALDLKAALIIYIDTDRKQMREFVVLFDPDFYEEHVRLRVRRFFRHVERKTMPEREGSGNPRTPPCAWCPFTQICYTTDESKRFLKKLRKAPEPKQPHEIKNPRLRLKARRRKQ